MANENDGILGMEEALNKVLVGGKLPCPMAFKVAREFKVAAKEVGEKADELGIRIIDCQLGCFGAKKATHDDLKGAVLDDKVAGAVRSKLSEGQLRCEEAWGIAHDLTVTRKKVGDTTTQMKVRLVNCQLGC